MHVVEVDQSGRVDETDKPTVLAMANGIRYSIFVPASVKRECLSALRQRWGRRPPKSLYIILFATLVYLLLKERSGDLSHVIIDTEYVGHEATIKEHVINLFRRRGIEVDPYIFSFRQVGKRSPAHDLAWKVFNRRIEPDRIISAEEILAEFRPIKRDGDPSRGNA